MLKTPQNIKSCIFWWNEPNLKLFETKNALKHIKTAQNTKISLAGQINLFEAKSAKYTSKLLKTSKVAFSGEMSYFMSKQVSFSGEMNQIWNQKHLKVPKTAQNFIT